MGTTEIYNADNNQFIEHKIGVVRFEYSLKVLYEWEAKWKKPFLRGDRTDEELLDFYTMMALDPIIPEAFTNDVVYRIAEYVSDANTATRFTSIDDGQNGNGMPKKKDYTAEEIYALMFINRIPLEFENRNINRLLTILRVISNYNSPPKKMTQDEIFRQNRELNKQRREQFKSKG